MTRVLTFLLILLAAIWLFAQFLRKTGMFFPDKFPTGRWDTKLFMVQPEEQWFTAEDGVRLHAWLFRSADTRAPVMIWFHGNAGNLTDRAEMAAELARRGVSVFLFDWRGYGRSEGKASERGLFRDALAAHDYVKTWRTGDPACPDRQDCLSSTRIVLYGESIGGPYAAFVAKERPGVHAVIIENSFPSLRALGNAFYKPLPLGWAAPFALRTSHWLNEANVPVLVMHGTRDQVIPYALGRKLFDDLRVPKELLTADAGHCEIPLFEADRYYEAVVRFARQRLSSETHVLPLPPV